MNCINDECGANVSGVSLSGTGLDEVSSISATRPYAPCQVGEHFFFGSYPQGRNGEVQPLEWLVLARESDRVLAIAEYGLAVKAYNEKWVATNWSQCTLRSWLNGEFMEEAFNPEEQGCLMEVTLTNPGSPAAWNSVPGGPDTRDKVFLLSMCEAECYSSGDDARFCRPTAYAVEQGAWVPYKGLHAGKCWWWLRSPGCYATSALRFTSSGSFDHDRVSNGNGVVRPAVYLAL